MSRVTADITVSLDGFVTGPGADPEHGLGHGGEQLHAWVESGHEVDRAALEHTVAATGAVVMGRNLFDVIDGPHGWSDAMGYGADLAATPPFFVVTSSEPETVRLEGSHDFTFVLNGPAAALQLARAAAGSEDVVIMGGGTIVRGCLDAGLVDQLRLHLSPIVLGAGTPLWSGASRRILIQRDVQVSPFATHLTYDVQR